MQWNIKTQQSKAQNKAHKLNDNVKQKNKK
jgi:hypothetical protein